MTNPRANGRTYANSYFVCGDAQATLEALLPRIEGRMKPDLSIIVIARKGPSLVEVDMTSLGEFPAYYPFNPRPTA